MQLAWQTLTFTFVAHPQKPVQTSMHLKIDYWYKVEALKLLRGCIRHRSGRSGDYNAQPPAAAACCLAVLHGPAMQLCRSCPGMTCRREDGTVRKLLDIVLLAQVRAAQACSLQGIRGVLSPICAPA